MAEQSSNRSGSGGRVVALFIVVGLLVGAGVMTPFVVKWRNSALQAEEQRQAEARRAEEARQQAAALEKQRAEIKENLGKAENTITTLKTDLSERDKALDALKQTASDKAAEAESLRADVLKKSREVTDLDDQLKIAKQQTESAAKENTTLTSRANALRSKLSRLAESIDMKTAEITKLVETTKKQETEKQAVAKEAEQAQHAATEAKAQAAAVEQELMARAPVRVEERHASKTGRQLGAKSGVPFAGALDPVGDIFTGLGEGLFGKKGPVIWVAVYQDKREEVITREEAEKWGQRGIRVVRLNEKKA
jgi:chromosome segregation ATPase